MGQHDGILVTCSSCGNQMGLSGHRPRPGLVWLECVGCGQLTGFTPSTFTPNHLLHLSLVSIPIRWELFGDNASVKLPRQRTVKQPIPPDLRWAVWERDNFTCQKCGIRQHLAVDHVIPESKGGLMVYDNLQTLCNRCNRKKKDRLDACDTVPL